MNHADGLTLPQIHVDMLDIGKSFTLEILLWKMIFLKKKRKKIYVNSICERSINLFASAKHSQHFLMLNFLIRRACPSPLDNSLSWWLRPCHLLPGLQKHAVPGHGATSPSASHTALSAEVDLISNTTSCNQDKFNFYTLYGLLIHQWLKLNLSPFIQGSQKPESRTSEITRFSHWRLQLTAPLPVGLPASNLNLFWRPMRHTRTPRGDKDDYDLSHILPQTEVELQYSGQILRHYLHFELSSQMKPLSKLHIALQKYYEKNSKNWVCKQMLVSLASTLMESTWEPHV